MVPSTFAADSFLRHVAPRHTRRHSFHAEARVGRMVVFDGRSFRRALGAAPGLAVKFCVHRTPCGRCCRPFSPCRCCFGRFRLI